MYNVSDMRAVSKMGPSFERTDCSTYSTCTYIPPEAVFRGIMHGVVSKRASFLSRKGSPRMFVMAQLSHKQRLHHLTTKSAGVSGTRVGQCCSAAPCTCSCDMTSRPGEKDRVYFVACDHLP